METPKVFGPYHVESPLSGGAMGTVYRARHEDSDELVALKTVAVPVRVQLASLRREIQALQAVSHPNVVEIKGHGADPVPWYAMELVEGLPLSQHWKTTPIEERWPRYAAVFCDVCNGLGYLHGLSMVHRDLKPANIMVRASDDEAPGAGVLVDFGLATVSAGGVGRELLYKRSEVVGTPQYISPEQVQQDPVDARTDLYALGCILFELLTGQPPFPAAVPIVGMLRHVNDTPIVPDRITDRLPPELVDLVLSLLAKGPQDRPGYAEDVRDRLAAIAGIDPPTDVPQPHAYLYRPRLVGRADTEPRFDELAAEFAAGKGGLCVVRGAAGAGKSRLVIEMIRRIHVATEVGVEVLMAESTSDEARASSFESLRRAFDEIADWCVERGKVATDKLLGVDGLHLSRVFDAIAALPGIEGVEPPPIPPRDFEERMCEAVSHVLVRFARVRPLVLAIDDLQWSDALTRRWLAALQWNPVWKDAPILVIVAGRYGDFLLDALTHHDDAKVFRSPQLSPDAVQMMVRDMIAADEVPPEFSAAVVERAAGYPARVAEWLYEAVRRGVLQREHGEWTFAGRSLDDERIGNTVSTEAPLDAFFARAVADLDAEQRAALEVLAGVGVVIGGELFEALRERLPAADSLVTEGFLEEIGRGDLRFVTESARTSVYEQLSPTRKVEVHAHIVRALEDAPTDSGTLARHLAGSGAVEKALGVLSEAASAAHQRGESAMAERLYAQYFETLPADSPPTGESVEARARQAQTLQSRGDAAAAEVALQLAEAQVESIEDSRVRGMVRRVRGGFLRARNEIRPAIEALDEAYRLLKSADCGDEARDALIDIGNCWCRDGKFEVGRDVFQRALDSARAEGDGVRAATALTSIGMTYMSTRSYAEAVKILARAANEFHELEELSHESYALMHLGQALSDMGRYDEAAEALRGAYEVRFASGDTRGAATALLHLGHAYLGAGHVKESIDVLQSVIGVLERAEEKTQLAVAHGYLGEALGLERRVDEAMDHFVAALNLHRELPYSALEPYVHLEISKLHRRLGMYADAEHHLGLASEKAGEDPFFEVTRDVECARLALARGQELTLDLASLGARIEEMALPPTSALTRLVTETVASAATPPHELKHGERPESLPAAYR